MTIPMTGAIHFLAIPLLTFCLAGTVSAQTDASGLVRSNTTFALDLYHKLHRSNALYSGLGLTSGNIVVSPYSVSNVLGMALAGARGNTEKEMSEVLRFSQKPSELHPGFAALRSRLDEVQAKGKVQLHIASSLWPQRGHPFLEDYLALCAQYYGGSITPLDYQQDGEAARRSINEWVEARTNNRIKDLFRSPLDKLTRMVLVNAVYFKGYWLNPFDAKATKPARFNLSSAQSVSAPFMHQDCRLRYADRGSFSVLELPYEGSDVSMLILLPKEIDGLASLESGLTADSLTAWTNSLAKQEKREVKAYIPKFKIMSQFKLNDALVGLGMKDAFSDARADFSGMDNGNGSLYINAMIHKVDIEVNELGTEAAAATAAVMAVGTGPPTAPPPVFRADHPFVFLIRENSTGSILFLGRVTKPVPISTASQAW